MSGRLPEIRYGRVQQQYLPIIDNLKNPPCWDIMVNRSDMILVWHSAKEYIANRLFTSIAELECLLNRLLNEGELIIKWGRKVKNKGNACITV
jgi:Flp pilus assembly CpaF family ATPase